MTEYKCYEVQLDTTAVELMASTISGAILAAQELYPGQQIRSVLLKPDWTENDD